MEGLKKKRIRHSLTAWILIVCLAVSLTCLVLYVLDLDYSDAILALLLNALRYSSFFLCVLSFYKLLKNLYRAFRRPSFSVFMQIFLYIILIAYGLAVFFLESFVSVIAGGNG